MSSPPTIAFQGDCVFSFPGVWDQWHQAGDKVPREPDISHPIGHQESEPQCQWNIKELDCMIYCVQAHMQP